MSKAVMLEPIGGGGGDVHTITGVITLTENATTLVIELPIPNFNWHNKYIIEARIEANEVPEDFNSIISQYFITALAREETNESMIYPSVVYQLSWNGNLSYAVIATSGYNVLLPCVALKDGVAKFQFGTSANTLLYRANTTYRYKIVYSDVPIID